MIHNISLPPGQYGTGCIDALFTNTLDVDCHPELSDLAGVAVSSHLLIDRQGKITQYVPLNRRAWHAGVSCFQGVKNCNDFSIGIELEGVDDNPYTPIQYSSLISVTTLLLQIVPRISLTSLAGHCEIAPGRKTDPGPAFDWPLFLRSLLTQPDFARPMAQDADGTGESRVS